MLKAPGNRHTVFTNTVEDFRNSIKEEHFVKFFGVNGISKNILSLRFRFNYKPKSICNFGKTYKMISLNIVQKYYNNFTTVLLLLLTTGW
jgi:hypothetical protein